MSSDACTVQYSRCSLAKTSRCARNRSCLIAAEEDRKVTLCSGVGDEMSALTIATRSSALRISSTLS
eukprot:4111832-Pleurochrysis_carterae.AAC.1